MKRIISILLCTVVIFGAFVSCAEGTADETEPAAVSSVDVSTEEDPVETENPDYKDDLPELNYNDAEIKIVSSDREWYKNEVWVEGITGETVNDAVYARNAAVEERLGVKFNNIQIAYNNDNGSLVTAIEKAYNSGDKLYDIGFANSYRVCMATTKGLFVDLNTVENIDLSKKYWMQNYNETISFHGAQFSATGSISLSTMRFAFATFINKNMFDSHGVEYPYQTVLDGKWTLDYFLTLLPVFYEDTDGSQTATDGDVYSWIANDYIGVDPFWVGCEIPILTKNADGDYEYSVDTAKLSDVVDKLLALYKSEGTRNFAHTSSDAEQAEMSKAFAEGKGAMGSFRLIEAESDAMRSMTDKYGIVPMPKYNEEQQEYHTHVHDQYTVATVMATTDEADRPMLGAVLEAMACQSYKTTVPAYYEITLKYKYSSDPESWDMLDIVINNVDCDAGNLYYSSIGAPHDGLRSIMQSRNNTVASIYKTYSKAVPKQVKTLNENLHSLIGK